MAQLLIVTAIAIAAAFALRLLFPTPSARRQDPRDMKISDSAYGNTLPWGEGRVVVAAELVQATEPVRITKESQSGGKGGGGGGATTYNYFLTAAYACFDGEARGILRVWADKKLIYDATGLSTLDTKEEVTLRFALGTADQTPDAMTLADHASAVAPGYINTVMLYLDDFPLSIVGNHIPNIDVELDTVTAGVSPMPSSMLFVIPWDSDITGVTISSGMNADTAGVDILGGAGTTTEYGHAVLSCVMAYAKAYRDQGQGDAPITLLFCMNDSHGPWLPASVESASYLPSTSFTDYVTFYRVDTTPNAWTDTSLGGMLIPNTNQGTNQEADILDIWREVQRIQDVENFAEIVYLSHHPFTDWDRTYSEGGDEPANRGEMVDDVQAIATAIKAGGTKIKVLDYSVSGQGPGIFPSSYLPTNGWGPDLVDTSGFIQTITASYFFYEQVISWALISQYELEGGTWPGFGTWYTASLADYPDGYAAYLTLTYSEPPTNPTYGINYDTMTVFIQKYYIDLFGTVSASAIPLSTILRKIFNRAGLIENVDYDLSEVSAADTAWGFLVDSETTLGSLFEDILPLYFLMMVDEDGKIIIRERGAASVATIPISDFVVADSKDTTELDDAYAIELTDEADLPIATRVGYIDPLQEYEAGEAFWRRPLAPETALAHRKELGLKVPLILQPQVPLEAAYRWTYLPWVERSKIKFRTWRKYLFLSPGDPITIDFENGITKRARVLSCPIGADWTMEVTAVFENTGALEAAALTGTSGTIITRTIVTKEATTLFFIDALLVDADNLGTAARGYICGAPLTTTTGWAGYTTYESVDGVNFNPLETVPLHVPYGVCATTLGNPRSVFATDLDNTLTVDMTVGIADLASCTRNQLYNGANGAIIYKAGGEFEIIQYQTVEVLSATQVRLSVLSRGMKGTDVMATGHGAGETIVFLTPAAVKRTAIALTDIGKAKTYRGVTIGLDLETAADQPKTWQGYSEKPLAPVQVTGTQNAPSAGDITFAWVRRSRVGAGVVNTVWRAPLNEDTEAYEVDILDGDGGAVLRTLTATTNSVEYDTADRVTDGFDPMPASIFVRVYQISSTVGRGWSYQTEVIL